MPKINLCLLAGGFGGEKEVSLKSAQTVLSALDKNKYNITQYDPAADLAAFVNDLLEGKFDLIFPILHGPFGEDGKIQGLLDIFKAPYVFSGTRASAVAMNKQVSKLIAAKAGLVTAPDFYLQQGEEFDLTEIINKLGLPIVVKPVELGSSVGMTIAKNKEELEQGIITGFKYDNNLILEKFIKGRELTVPVWGNENPEAMPIIEIIPKVSEWFDYKAKYEVGGSEEVCPAEISDSVCIRIQESALKIFKAIGCYDLARVDFIWSEVEDKLYFLEINTIPGMTETSLVPQSAKAMGMEFSEFLDKLIKLALDRQK